MKTGWTKGFSPHPPRTAAVSIASVLCFFVLCYYTHSGCSPRYRHRRTSPVLFVFQHTLDHVSDRGCTVFGINIQGRMCRRAGSSTRHLPLLAMAMAMAPVETVLCKQAPEVSLLPANIQTLPRLSSARRVRLNPIPHGFLTILKSCQVPRPGLYRGPEHRFPPLHLPLLDASRTRPRSHHRMMPPSALARRSIRTVPMTLDSSALLFPAPALARIAFTIPHPYRPSHSIGTRA